MNEKDTEALKAEIAKRLRPLCQTWPVAMFDALVLQIASITIKYDHGIAAVKYDPTRHGTRFGK